MLKKIGLPAIALLGSRSGRRGPPLGAAGPPVGSAPRLPLRPVTGGSDMLDRRRDGRLRTAVFSWARVKYTGSGVGQRLTLRRGLTPPGRRRTAGPPQRPALPHVAPEYVSKQTRHDSAHYRLQAGSSGVIRFDSSRVAGGPPAPPPARASTQAQRKARVR